MWVEAEISFSIQIDWRDHGSLLLSLFTTTFPTSFMLKNLIVLLLVCHCICKNKHQMARWPWYYPPEYETNTWPYPLINNHDHTRESTKLTSKRERNQNRVAVLQNYPAADPKINHFSLVELRGNEILFFCNSQSMCSSATINLKA